MPEHDYSLATNASNETITTETETTAVSAPPDTFETPQPSQMTMTNLSLFIPRVHRSIKEDKIKEIFNRLNFGVIKRVDIVIPGMKHDPHQELEEDITTPPEPLPLFNLCFIHYSSWNEDNESAMNFYNDVFVKEEEARIRYDMEGHFFKVYKNKNPKSDEQYELEQAFMKQQKIIQQLKQRCSFYESLFHNMEDLLVRGKDAVENVDSENEFKEQIPYPPFVVGKKYTHRDGSVFEFVENDDGSHNFVLIDE
jgi:hypothetical protein